MNIRNYKPLNLVSCKQQLWQIHSESISNHLWHHLQLHIINILYIYTVNKYFCLHSHLVDWVHLFKKNTDFPHLEDFNPYSLLSPSKSLTWEQRLHKFSVPMTWREFQINNDNLLCWPTIYHWSRPSIEFGIQFWSWREDLVIWHIKWSDWADFCKRKKP